MHASPSNLRSLCDIGHALLCTGARRPRSSKETGSTLRRKKLNLSIYEFDSRVENSSPPSSSTECAVETTPKPAGSEWISPSCLAHLGLALFMLSERIPCRLIPTNLHTSISIWVHLSSSNAQALWNYQGCLCRGAERCNTGALISETGAEGV